MRARPSAQMLAAQREAEAQWRLETARLPFESKVRKVMELQRLLYPVLAAKGRLQWWQRPWRIDGDKP